MKIFLIDNYDSFTFNLYHYISSLNVNVDVVRNDKINSKEIIKKNMIKLLFHLALVIQINLVIVLDIVRKLLYKKLPFLGVCLGHQIIGQVFGSKIVQAKKLMHGKTSKIKSKKIRYFKKSTKTFEATRYHSLVLIKNPLSKELRVTAYSEDGVIMGVQHKKFNIHGVQFHPESIKTKVGMKILKTLYIFRNLWIKF